MNNDCSRFMKPSWFYGTSYWQFIFDHFFSVLWNRGHGSSHPVQVEDGPCEDGGEHGGAIGQPEAGQAHMDHPAVEVNHKWTSGVPGADGLGAFRSGQGTDHVVLDLDIHEAVLLVTGGVLNDLQLDLAPQIEKYTIVID